MLKKVLIPAVILGMLLFTQCTDDPVNPDFNNPSLKAGNGNGNGGGGNGGGGGGGGGGNGGSGGLYGDLVICLRTPDGIPIYEEIEGEQETAYYPQPIMVEEVTLEPFEIEDVYQTFALTDEGDVIPETGYIVKEVEFGRLNVVRAPQSVMDQALSECIGSLTQAGITNITTDASGRLVAIIGAEDWLVNFDDDPLNDESDDKTIDAPRENVALYQEMMSYGLENELSFLANGSYDIPGFMVLAFGAIAAGADKTGIMNVDEFAYMNNWLLKWDSPTIAELSNSPDVRDRHYFDYSGFTYSRIFTYSNKYVRITVLNPDGTWEDTYESLLDVVPWTEPSKLIDYTSGQNLGITGFANAADDAVQVIEFIHASDLVVYSPYFTADGFVAPE